MAIPSWAMTYDSLVSTVYQYLERKDPAVVSAIPTFISLAEFEISQEVKTLGQMQVVGAQMMPGSPSLEKPARWRKTVSMSLTVNGKSQPLLLRKFEYLQNYWPDSTVTGTPLYYSDTDWDHWYIAPTPDIAYQFKVLYYERIEPLSESSQTNWLTRNAPNAMLFGTLLQAAIFVKNDERQATFQQKYQEALAALKTEDVARVGDRSAVAVDS